jgi:UDP-N-acetylmuramoylalanine--D-glutamate ligase
METYRSALILGYGRSGRAAERMLKAEGCDTVVLSQETAGNAEVSQILERRDFDICIVSPGFGLSNPWLCAVREAGVPLLSELELGWSRHQGKTVAITGSNGKSTAVKLIHESFQLAGIKSAIGGNYGIPACEVVLENPDLDWLVLEVSSFQLETVRDFHADVAVVLNVLPNHLDRHESMELYRKTKARIFGPSSSTGGICLVPANLRPIFKDDVDGERRWLTFGSSADADYRFENSKVLQGLETILDLSDTLFDSLTIGSCTGASAAAVAHACKLPFEVVERAARRFKPLPHRLQRMGSVEGVTYVNDSKATNLAATAAALLATGENIHLIAGGLPKESDYTFVKEILAERVRSIYVIGQASRAMYQAWNGVCPCVECGTLENAFNTARNAARAGDFILLSPGCASFDQFRSFEERGERFMTLFQELKQAGGDAHET